jgi:hypothetical protein
VHCQIVLSTCKIMTASFGVLLMPSMCRVVGLALALAVFAVEPAQAQAGEPSLAAGIAIPTGGLGTERMPGPLLRAGYTFGDHRSSHVRVRLDLEAAWLLARAGASTRGRGTFRSVTALASLLLGATAAAPVSPYGLVGLAVERLAITGRRNPYGSTVGLRAGLGARWRLRDRLIFAEVAPHVALTDFGTGRDFDVGVRVPLVVGIAF